MISDLNGRKVAWSLEGNDGPEPPLIILNGIMMSMASWRLFAEPLGKTRRLVLMDFLDQGQSGRLEGITYKHDLQVDTVSALMDHLGYKRYDLSGVSYGAQVAIQVALKRPDAVRKLVAFNACAWTTPWLSDIGKAWIKAALSGDPEQFYHVTIPYIYSNGFYTRENAWMEKRKAMLLKVFDQQFMNAMIRLINSSEGYDVRGALKEIQCPVLVVGAQYDHITSPDETRLLHEGIPGSLYVEIGDCGHASMYEKPAVFTLLLNGFLSMDNNISAVN